MTAVTPAVAAGAQGVSMMEDIISIHINTSLQNPNNQTGTGPPPRQTIHSGAYDSNYLTSYRLFCYQMARSPQRLRGKCEAV